ncbi:MAG: hypothetical protein ACYS1A_10780 [Planctomycetota bacterium]|jgi:hypothetical protein
MSLLSKIFGYVPVDERKGIYLTESTYWEISGVKDFPAFLRAVSDLVISDSVLYLEGGTPPKKLKLYLKKRAATNTSKVEMGTIWPRPECFHMQITRANLEGLAELVESYATPQVAVHLHIYKSGKMFLEWYDAFFDPLRISREIQETVIKEFSNKLGADYKEVTDK